MSQPFIGEVRSFGFNFPPRGWALCNGQIMSIAQNQALFSVLGTTYGGDGVTTFALPNLQGCVPVHVGQGMDLGQKGGSATITLNTQQIPHTHLANAITTTANQPLPQGNLPGNAAGQSQYGTTMNTTLNSAAVGPAGGGAAHNNMQPSLVISFGIALVGIYPSKN